MHPGLRLRRYARVAMQNQVLRHDSKAVPRAGRLAGGGLAEGQRVPEDLVLPDGRSSGTETGDISACGQSSRSSGSRQLYTKKNRCSLSGWR